MKIKYLLLLTLTIGLVGCSKETEVDVVPGVVLTPPIVEEVKTEEDNKSAEKVEKQLKELQITDRTKIMVDEKNMDTFNKKETSTEGPTEEVVEENKLLSRFKENMANISFPLNYRVVGTAKVSEEKTVDLSVSRMSTGEAYTCYNYDNIVLEQYIVDDRLNYTDKYVSYKCDGFSANGKLKTDVASDMITFDDFRVTGISNVLKNGNNYKVDATFIMGTVQVDGNLVVGDNMNVYNMNFIRNGITYDLKVQTVLKMPKDKSSFKETELTDDENSTYCSYASNILSVENVTAPTESTNPSSDIPTEGLIDTKETVDVKLDEQGNITEIHVIKTYVYDDGSLIIQTIIKDKDGAIISEDIKKSNTSEETTIANETSEISLKPTFSLDENISAEQLTESLANYKNEYLENKTITYSIVDVNDPTKWAVDFKGNVSEEVLKELITKFAEDNYTVVVEWR